MTRHFISMVEAGRAVPSEKTLRVIAQRLGKAVDYFREGAEMEDVHADIAVMLLQGAEQKAETGDHESATRMIQHLLKTCQEPALRASARSQLITCLARLRRFEEALSECERAVEEYQALQDREGLVRVYMQMGAIAFAAEEFSTARRAYEQAVKYSSGLKRLAESHLEALTYLGSSLAQVGELVEAAAVYKTAFEESLIQGCQIRQGRIAMGLGKALFAAGQADEGLKWTLRAVDLLNKAHSQEEILALHNLAIIQAARGAHADAYAIYQRCLEVYRAKGWIVKQASVLEDLAEYWLKLGDLQQAKACCKEAVDLLEEESDGIMLGRLYRLLGTIMQMEGGMEQAYFCLRMSYDLLRRMKNPTEAALSYEALKRLSAGNEAGCEPPEEVTK